MIAGGCYAPEHQIRRGRMHCQPWLEKDLDKAFTIGGAEDYNYTEYLELYQKYADLRVLSFSWCDTPQVSASPRCGLKAGDLRGVFCGGALPRHKKHPPKAVQRK
jgi:hypothetical protein